MDLQLGSTPPPLAILPHPPPFPLVVPLPPLHHIDEDEEVHLYNVDEVAAVHTLATMQDVPTHTRMVLPHRNLSTLDPRILRRLPITLDASVAPDQRVIRPLPQRARLLLPPRDRPPTPFPFLDEGILTQARQIQLAMVAAQGAGRGMSRIEEEPMEIEDEGEELLEEGEPQTRPQDIMPRPSPLSHLVPAPTNTESLDSTSPNSTMPRFDPTPEWTPDPVEELARTVVAGTLCAFLTKNELTSETGLENLGLSLGNPAATFPDPLFEAASELGEEFRDNLARLLPDTPTLPHFNHALQMVQLLVPQAQRSELYSRIVAGAVSNVEQLAREAQEQTGAGRIHSWIIFHDALRTAQVLLAERAEEQVEIALNATRVYRFWADKISNELDDAIQTQRLTHQLTHRLLDGEPSTPLDPSSAFSGDWNATVDRAFEREIARAEMSLAAMHLAEDLEDPTMNHSYEGFEDGGVTWDVDEGATQDLGEEGTDDGFGTTVPPSLTRVTRSPSPTTIDPLQVFYSSRPATPSFSFNDHVTDDEFDTSESSGGRISVAEKFFTGSDSFVSVTSHDLVIRDLIDESGELFAQGRLEEARELWYWATRCVVRSVHPPLADPLRSREGSPTGNSPPPPLDDDGHFWGWNLPTEAMGVVEELESSEPGDDSFFERALQTWGYESTPWDRSEVSLPLESIVHSRYLEDSDDSSTNQARELVAQQTAASPYPQFGASLRIPTNPPFDYRPYVATALVPPPPAVEYPAPSKGKERADDKRPWYRADAGYTVNNPTWTHFPSQQPTYDDAPLLPLTEYAKARAFQVAPLGPNKAVLDSGAPATFLYSLAPPAPPLSPSSNSTTDPFAPAFGQRRSFMHYITEMRTHVFPYEGDSSVGGQMNAEISRVIRELDMEHALAFTALCTALHHAYDRSGLGQLVDWSRMLGPNGQRTEYDWDRNYPPIVVDVERDELQESFFCMFLYFFLSTYQSDRATDGPHFDVHHEALYTRQSILAFLHRVLPFLCRQGADLLHGFYKWLEHCRYPTHRRRLLTHPLLQNHEMGLCEIVYSLLHENGYYKEAEEFEEFLRVRYTCEEVIRRFLEDGYLDFDLTAGDQGYWSRDLPGLICFDSPDSSDLADANDSLYSDVCESDVSSVSSLDWLYVTGGLEEDDSAGDLADGVPYDTAEEANVSTYDFLPSFLQRLSFSSPSLSNSRPASAPVGSRSAAHEDILRHREASPVVAPTPQYPLPTFLDIDTTVADAALYELDDGSFDSPSEDDDEVLADNEASDREATENAVLTRWPTLAQWIL
ncbi:hypothetical protein C8F01DRAFT_1089684 [Mycena amicta]|nr:hypothetical protein C8F01DRAFT_1089684 [Mycena amicta]